MSVIMKMNKMCKFTIKARLICDNKIKVIRGKEVIDRKPRATKFERRL